VFNIISNVLNSNLFH